MSRSISITVPVKYEAEGAEYKLLAVIDNYIIGRDTNGALVSFNWASGRRLSYAVSEADIEKASQNKVRRNFWARKLVDYWNKKTTAESVRGGFAADDLFHAFQEGNETLALREGSSLAEVLLAIVED